MKNIVLIYLILLVFLLVISCDAQKSVYSNEDVSNLKIAYAELMEGKYKGESIIISDSISSGDLKVFQNKLFEKQKEKLVRKDFYYKIDSLNKLFKVRDSFSLKKTLNNGNKKGDYVFFFSKIVESILTVNVYELDHSIPDKRKIKTYNYPYSELFFKSPKKVYFFRFNKDESLETIEETVFWQ